MTRPTLPEMFGQPVWYEDGQAKNVEAEYIEEMEDYANTLEDENRRLREELEAALKALREYQHDHHGTNQSWFEEAKKIAAEVVSTREALAQAQARIESLEKAQEIRVKALRQVQARAVLLQDALQDLYDEQNGPPLVKYEKTWQAAYDKAGALLISFPPLPQAPETPHD